MFSVHGCCVRLRDEGRTILQRIFGELLLVIYLKFRESALIGNILDVDDENDSAIGLSASCTYAR